MVSQTLVGGGPSTCVLIDLVCTGAHQTLSVQRQGHINLRIANAAGVFASRDTVIPRLRGMHHLHVHVAMFSLHVRVLGFVCKADLLLWKIIPHILRLLAGPILVARLRHGLGSRPRKAHALRILDVGAEKIRVRCNDRGISR